MAKILNTILTVLTATLCSFAYSEEGPKSPLRALVIPLAASKASLDPRLVLDQSSLWINRQLNCQLVRHEGSEVVNDAAKKIEFKTPTEIEITLKNNVFFSDGSLVTAEDVAATFEFLKQARKVHRNIFQWVRQITTISSDRLRIALKKQTPQFLKTLGAPTQPIYSKNFLKRAEQNSDAWNSPISCGGYYIKEWTKDNRGRTVLALEPVREKLHPIRFLLTGTNNVPADDILQYDMIGLSVSGDSPILTQQYQVVELFDPYQIFFAINTKLLPWSTKEKRCRLLQSMDPEMLINAYNGAAEPSTDWFPRGIIGYVNTQAKILPQTPVTFEQPFCLAMLGVSIPEPLRPTYLSMLKNIFSDVQSKVIDNTKSFGRSFLNSKCDAIIFGLKSGYLDGYEYLQFFIEEEANVTGWSDPKFAKTVKESQDIADSLQRAKVYHQIVGRIDHECLARPLMTIPQKKVYYRKSLSFPDIGKYSLDGYYLGLVR